MQDFGKQNTCGNVSKLSVRQMFYWQIGSRSTNPSPLARRREGHKVTQSYLTEGQNFNKNVLFTKPIFLAVPDPVNILKRQQSSPCYADKIFCHYEFLAQFVFGPRFKQRHIPRYNCKKTTTTEKPTWNRQEQWHVNAAHVLNQKLRNPFVSDHWKTFWHESQMPHWAGHILDQIPHCMELSASQMPGDYHGGEGGDGRFWNWLVHVHYKQSTLINKRYIHVLVAIWL